MKFLDTHQLQYCLLAVAAVMGVILVGANRSVSSVALAVMVTMGSLLRGSICRPAVRRCGDDMVPEATTSVGLRRVGPVR